jgi:hypothetical protein
MWARADVRARWKALVALGLLVGVTAGFAIAAYAGARRTDASFERLRDRTAAADAVVFATQTQAFIIDTKLWDDLAAQPGVESVAPWVLALGDVDPGDGYGVMMGPLDDRWLNQVDRPVVVAGRMWDPNAADEIVLDEMTADHDNLELGDTVTFHAYRFSQMEPGADPGPPAGPEIDLKIVGIVRTVQPFVFTSIPMMSPGVIAKYASEQLPEGERIVFGTNAMVRLRDAGSGMRTLQSDVDKIIEPGTPVLDLHEVQRRVDTTLDVEGAALRLLALSIALAGGFLVGQALSRSASTIQSDAYALRSIGLTRRDMTMAAVRAHGLVAGVAVLVAVAVAMVASRWFPVGLAAGIDPDRGFHADWLVLAIGLFATMLFVATVVVLSAYQAVRVRRVVGGRRTTKFIDSVQRRTPVSVGVGTAMVLERGRPRVNIPIRQAIAGAVIGVVGVVATLTINAQMRDAVAHPERAGVTFDVLAGASDEAAVGASLQPVLDEARASNDVDAFALGVREVITVNDIGVPTWTLDPAEGSKGAPIAFTVLQGRAPAEGEAVIGPKNKKDLGVNIGDTVMIGTKEQPVRIVGTALFPQDVHSGFDEGLWITSRDLDTAQPIDLTDKNQRPRNAGVAIRLKPGADPEVVAGEIGAAVGGDFVVQSNEIPSELTNLKYVRTLPLVLAVFLALLALAALLHVLTTVARTRKSVFAVLRALGMTRRSTRAVINVQGTTIAVVGLVVGIPVGVLVGRSAWNLIAESVPIANVSVQQWLALVTVVVVALVAANLLALWPGRRAARLHPAEVLRSE